jgi:uncharacterized protein (DUF4415 family)
MKHVAIRLDEDVAQMLKADSEDWERRTGRKEERSLSEVVNDALRDLYYLRLAETRPPSG